MSKQLFQFQISKINEEESLLTIRNVSENIPEGIFLFISSNEYTFSICAENTLHIPFKNITLSRNDFSQTIPNSEIKTIKRALKEFHSYCYKKFSNIVPKKKSLQDYLKERNVTEEELLEVLENKDFKVSDLIEGCDCCSNGIYGNDYGEHFKSVQTILLKLFPERN